MTFWTKRVYVCIKFVLVCFVVGTIIHTCRSWYGLLGDTNKAITPSSYQNTNKATDTSTTEPTTTTTTTTTSSLTTSTTTSTTTTTTSTTTTTILSVGVRTSVGKLVATAPKAGKERGEEGNPHGGKEDAGGGFELVGGLRGGGEEHGTLHHQHSMIDEDKEDKEDKRKEQDRRESALRGPFVPGERSIDLIVTWVNMSEPRWLAVANAPGGTMAESDYDHGFTSTEPYNPLGADLSTNFVELKYCLRSVEKFGLMKYVRKIHIVHSDLYDPPNYLRKNHSRLHFVPHSTIFAHLPKDVRDKGLPTFSRNSIDSQLHHIPGLSDWFLRLDDDFFMTADLVEEDFWKGGKMQVHGKAITQTVSAPCARGSDSYYGPMAVASCLLREKFGSKTRRYTDHYPVLGFRPAIEEMEALWGDRFALTASTTEDDPSDIYWSAFTTMYLEDTGLAEYSRKDTPPHFEELHTNSASFCPRPCGGYDIDIADDRLAKVSSFLDGAIPSTCTAPDEYPCSLKLNWVNLQGPGFDDAYRYRWNKETREYSPKIETVARAFWEKNYPTKTEFEV